jgi:hypothetical protein
MEFVFDTLIENRKIKFSSSIGQENTSAEHIYFLEETVKDPLFFRKRNADNKYITDGRNAVWPQSEYSILTAEWDIRKFVESWQFLSMNTFLMGNPYPQKKTGGRIILNHDGSNIAEYILAIRDADPDVFKGIIETIQFVLPYAVDIQPVIAQELEKMVYMQMNEQDFKVPGWLL